RITTPWRRRVWLSSANMLLRRVEQADGSSGIENGLVVIVAGGNEFLAREGIENGTVLDRQQGGLHLVGKAFAPDTVDVATDHPVVIQIGRRLPDNAHFFRVDLSLRQFFFPDLVVDRADIPGTALHQCDG